MLEVIRDLIATIKLVQNNLPALKEEFQDLSGVTKTVIEQFIKIWSD